MPHKRRLFTREIGPAMWSAQLEGRAELGHGKERLDAVHDLLEQLKGVSVTEVRLVPCNQPLPLTDRTTCRGETYVIVVGKLNKFMHTAAVSPPTQKNHRYKTRMTPADAVIAVLNKNRGILREGNRVDISWSQEVPSSNHRMVISRCDTDYIASLDNFGGADTGAGPTNAACGVIRANPHILFRGNRLRIVFPNELVEEPYHDYL